MGTNIFSRIFQQKNFGLYIGDGRYGRRAGVHN